MIGARQSSKLKKTVLRLRLTLVVLPSKLIQFLSRKGVKRIARWVIPYLVKKFKRANSRRNKISRRRPKR